MEVLYDDALYLMRRIAVVVAGDHDAIMQALAEIAATYQPDHTALMVKVYQDAESVKFGGWSAQATWRAGRDPAWLIDFDNDIEARRKVYQRLHM